MLNVRSPQEESLQVLLRQHGWDVRVLDFKSGDPKSKSLSDRQVDLFQVVPGLTSRLRLYIANWSASYQLRFLTC